jgi:hypothetical protein
MMRALGIILLVVGGAMTAIGLADFFAAFGEVGETPDRFWMAMVGLPFASAGGWLIVLSFGGRIFRSLARGAAPTIRETLDELSARRMNCRSCGASNAAGAKFCASCGTPLGSQCRSCGAINEADSQFCGSCGAAV